MNRKAGGVMEYVLVLGVVSAAVSGMFIYLKRGVQARVKDMTNGLVVKELSLTERQYMANLSSSDATTEYNSASYQDILGNSATNTVNETIVSNSSEESVPEGWEGELEDN